MKKIAFLINCLFILTAANAQMPQLTVDGKIDNGVSLQQLKINVSVCGSVATTTWQMVFKNNTNRILEGNLSFPVKEGVSVSRYALDVNGKMREAVPVDKSKGTAVFETLERRRIDPGLLEKAAGNIFRTRIYPINPNSTRTVIIGYEEELPLTNATSLKYYLPLNLKDAVDDFSVDINVQSNSEPVIDSSVTDNFHFESKHDFYTASAKRKNYVPDNSLQFSIPKEKNIADAIMQEKQGEYYFLVNTFIDKETRTKPLPSHITILWDASLSAAGKNSNQEMELLQDYFSHAQNATVSVVTFSNTIQSNKTYSLVNGNWDSLKNDLQKKVYDGATNFGCLDLNKMAGDEFLLFSDGHQTFGSNPIRLSKKRVYCINSNVSGDFSNLQYISQTTNAVAINLQSMQVKEAVDLLLNEPLRFIGIKNNKNIEEVYPANANLIGNRFSIAGICKNEQDTISLQFGFGDKVSAEKTIYLKAEDNNENFNISRIWAEKKIAALDIQYQNNKQTIEALGKRFGIATRNTSLIVLESINDYIQYDIEPPAELREEYDQIMKQTGRQIAIPLNENTRPAIDMATMLDDWYNQKRETDIQKKTVVKEIARSTNRSAGNTQSSVSSSANLDQVVVTGYATQRRSDVTASTTRIRADEVRDMPEQVRELGTALQGRVAGVQVTQDDAQPGYLATVQVREAATNNLSDENYYSTNKDNEDKISLSSNLRSDSAIIDYPANVNYLKEIKASDNKNRYTVYLALRKYFGSNPVFYFEVAHVFFKNNQKETGLKILSNLSELDLSNFELDRMLGYKLKQQGDYENEINVFKKVSEERSGEPQSYRDYALALEDAGMHQQALDELYLGMTKQYNGDVSTIYRGIEETFLPEINRILALHKNLNTKKLPKEIIHNDPVDLRVVIDWNKTNTDIDLWVTDPNEEKCFFSHKTTAIGGRISTDFTQGLGPEQFLLKKAIPGKYRIEVNYYGDRQVTIAGPTTILAEIYKYYGTEKEEKKLVVLQMEKGKQGAVFIGELSF